MAGSKRIQTVIALLTRSSSIWARKSWWQATIGLVAIISTVETGTIIYTIIFLIATHSSIFTHWSVYTNRRDLVGETGEWYCCQSQCKNNKRELDHKYGAIYFLKNILYRIKSQEQFNTTLSTLCNRVLGWYHYPHLYQN